MSANLAVEPPDPEDSRRASPLIRGGGDGTSGGMEARIAKLEVEIDYIKRDVGDVKAAVRGLQSDVTVVRIDVGGLKERVGHLPTKGFIVTSVVAGLGLLTALILFADRIKAAAGL